MITAIIPARIGSKRLVGKNFLPFCGRPLAEWSILVALHCDLIHRIIISTDNLDYKFDHPKVIVDYRDEEFCKYELHTDDIYAYVIKKYNIKGSKIILEPTSPIRTPDMIDAAIDIHMREGKSVISVYKNDWNPNGVYYIFKGERIYDDEVIPVMTSSVSGVDIDHWYQFRIAEHLFKQFHIGDLLRL